MKWNVDFHDDFYPEFLQLPEAARLELLAKIPLLEEFGPTLKRPHVDTLNGSTHPNMKELRFSAPAMASGESPSPSTPIVRPFSSSLAINRVAARNGFIKD